MLGLGSGVGAGDGRLSLDRDELGRLRTEALVLKDQLKARDLQIKVRGVTGPSAASNTVETSLRCCGAC